MDFLPSLSRNSMVWQSDFFAKKTKTFGIPWFLRGSSWSAPGLGRWGSASLIRPQDTRKYDLSILRE